MPALGVDEVTLRVRFSALVGVELVDHPNGPVRAHLPHLHFHGARGPILASGHDPAAVAELVLLDPKAGDDWVLNKMALGLVDQHYAPKVEPTYDAQMAFAALRMGDAEVVKCHVLYPAKLPDDLTTSLAAGAKDWETSGSKFASAVVPRVLVRTGDFPWRRGAI